MRFRLSYLNSGLASFRSSQTYLGPNIVPNVYYVASEVTCLAILVLTETIQD
jgi:hypothetical protein